MKRGFTSHVNDDEDSDSLLPLLCEGLRRRGLEVLIDRERLKPGAVWWREISTWLSLCHGAIVLLSPRALDADSI